jgi:hypothetical protein
MQQNQNATNLSVTLYSTLSMDEEQNLPTSLVDLLQSSLLNAALLQSKKTTEEMVHTFGNIPFGFI